MANTKKSGGCMAGTEIDNSIDMMARPAIGNSIAIAKKPARNVGNSKAKKKRS